MTARHTTASAPARALLAGPALLRIALRLDAVVTGANGAVYLAATGPVGDLLGVPSATLRATGAFLLAFAAALWLLSARPAPRPAAVRAVVAANVLWALDSVALAVAGWESPTTAGTVWIVLQALVVAAFAALQALGLRRGQVRVQRT